MDDVAITYCRYERMPIRVSETEMKDGSLLHRTSRPHRVIDGLSVRLEERVIVAVNDVILTVACLSEDRA